MQVRCLSHFFMLARKNEAPKDIIYQINCQLYVAWAKLLPATGLCLKSFYMCLRLWASHVRFPSICKANIQRVEFVAQVFHLFIIFFMILLLQNCKPDANICCTYRPPATTTTTTTTRRTTTPVPYATCPRDSDCVAPQDCRNGEISAINYVKKQGVSVSSDALFVRAPKTCLIGSAWAMHTHEHTWSKKNVIISSGKLSGRSKSGQEAASHLDVPMMRCPENKAFLG